MKLSEMIDKILEDTSASTGVPRSEMDHDLLFAAHRLEGDVKLLQSQVALLEGQNASLERDAMAKITLVMKNSEILTHDCEKLAMLLDIETTKVSYLGKLAELNRKKDPEMKPEAQKAACASVLALFEKADARTGLTVELLTETIKIAKTILSGEIPEETKVLSMKEES